MLCQSGHQVPIPEMALNSGGRFVLPTVLKSSKFTIFRVMWSGTESMRESLPRGDFETLNTRQMVSCDCC